MKLLICGDSWTGGYGVQPNEAWPNLLGTEFINTSKWGATNNCIKEQFLDSYNNNYDAVIIGWSGVTRFWKNALYDFSSVNETTLNYYKDKTLNDILYTWDNHIKFILEKSKVPVIQFSVFGDCPLIKYDNFLDKSYLEFLANKQNTYFKYNIPIFEFDWLNENNLLLTEEFGKKYFPKNWKRACVERENIRSTKYFLGCGHPNSEGHKLWAQHIKGVLDDIFSK
jgi:hypothetical protein